MKAQVDGQKTASDHGHMHALQRTLGMGLERHASSVMF